jgi:UDP-N-acetylenolpyruvoylglucosamine reductase
MSNTDPNKIRGWTQVLTTGKQQVFDNKLSNFTYKYSPIKKSWILISILISVNQNKLWTVL